MTVGRIAYMAAALFVCACSAPEVSIPAFDVPWEDGPGFRMEREAFRKFAGELAVLDAADAGRIIERSVSVADSISVAEGDPWTVEEYSHMLAGAFFDADSPYCNDALYSLVIDRMQECVTLTSLHRRMIDFRKRIIAMGSPGTAFPVEFSTDRPLIVFLRAEDCDDCRRISAEIDGSGRLARDIGAGLVAVETLTMADDDYDLMQKLDPRFVPSLYLLDKDGTVLLKGCGDLKTLLRSEEYKTLIK